jgi:hypothetical protein
MNPTTPWNCHLYYFDFMGDETEKIVPSTRESQRGPTLDRVVRKGLSET